MLQRGSTFLHTVFTIGVLGLMGAPFIGSFHSKHLILDVTQYVGSSPACSEHMAYVGFYLSPILTLGYSTKLLLFISQKPSLVSLSSSYIRGSFGDLKVITPISLLAIFRFVVGLLICQTIRGGFSTLISLEDIFCSLFFFGLFLGLYDFMFI